MALACAKLVESESINLSRFDPFDRLQMGKCTFHVAIGDKRYTRVWRNCEVAASMPGPPFRSQRDNAFAIFNGAIPIVALDARFE
jgi:hypothetical protein